MPNWCDCDLYVKGKKESIREFQEFARGKDTNEVLEAENFIPYPEEYRKADEEYQKWWDLPHEERQITPRPKGGFNNGGYEWCLKNWGTKWGICDSELVEEEDYGDGDIQLTYRFGTAWSPPVPLIKKMGEMFPDFYFELKYFEHNMAFNGLFIVENGEVTTDESGPYYGNRGG